MRRHSPLSRVIPPQKPEVPPEARRSRVPYYRAVTTVYLLDGKRRGALGHAEVVRNLDHQMLTCHPSHRESIRERINEARAGRDETTFDWLVEIFEEEVAGQLRLE
jgi:hypothetical protein